MNPNILLPAMVKMSGDHLLMVYYVKIFFLKRFSLIWFDNLVM